MGIDKEKYVRVVDLFAGCGGLSLGFEQAGFEVVAAFERWDAALACYRANLAHPAVKFDLSNTALAVEEIGKYKPEIIIGGPPCQDFSQAGKRIEADRANMTECYAQIVAAIKPRFFVMENVDQARRSRAYGHARQVFVDAGYGLTELVLDASLCGAPQKRKRFICFGAFGESDGFALATFESRLAKKPMTLRDYFGDSLGFEFYYRHPRNYSRRGIYSIDEPAPTMRGVNRPVPGGYPGHPNDPCPVSRDLHVLTTQERGWIQTFPRDFRWVGSKTDVEQMIGNAVPVALGKFVAETVQEYANKKKSGKNRRKSKES